MSYNGYNVYTNYTIIIAIQKNMIQQYVLSIALSALCGITTRNAMITFPLLMLLTFKSHQPLTIFTSF